MADMLTSLNLSETNQTRERAIVADDPYAQTTWVLVNVVSPTLCAFGIVGNILNILVLSRRQMKARSDNEMESTARLGLIVLAISDMLYCLVTLPGAFIKNILLYESRSFWLYYHVYGSYVRNSLSYTSTWLTVLMAVSRYMAICHPLHARIFIIPGATKLSVVVVTIMWFLLTLPEAFNLSIKELPIGNQTFYSIEMGSSLKNHSLRNVFTSLWSILGFIIPVAILAFCNARLIQALRQSQRMRKEYRVHQRTQQPGSKITVTLIAIVMMFLILVCPSEILNIVRYIQKDSSQEMAFALDAANVLHTLNFSVNFVLYCVVNVHFRSTLKDLFCRACALKDRKEPPGHIQASSTTMYTHVPARAATLTTNAYPNSSETVL